eukprot:m.102135 g.102135  ORF g.102135 m.102135 type:complete len:1106 (-) comp10425_c0_seq2:1259-4576(-)
MAASELKKLMATMEADLAEDLKTAGEATPGTAGGAEPTTQPRPIKPKPVTAPRPAAKKEGPPPVVRKPSKSVEPSSSGSQDGGDVDVNTVPSRKTLPPPIRPKSKGGGSTASTPRSSVNLPDTAPKPVPPPAARRKSKTATSPTVDDQAQRSGESETEGNPLAHADTASAALSGDDGDVATTSNGAGNGPTASASRTDGGVVKATRPPRPATEKQNDTLDAVPRSSTDRTGEAGVSTLGASDATDTATDTVLSSAPSEDAPGSATTTGDATEAGVASGGGEEGAQDEEEETGEHGNDNKNASTSDAVHASSPNPQRLPKPLLLPRPHSGSAHDTPTTETASSAAAGASSVPTEDGTESTGIHGHGNSEAARNEPRRQGRLASFGGMGKKLFRPKSKAVAAADAAGKGTAATAAPGMDVDELTNAERLEVLLKVSANVSGGTMSVDEAVAEVTQKELEKRRATLSASSLSSARDRASSSGTAVAPGTATVQTPPSSSLRRATTSSAASSTNPNPAQPDAAAAAAAGSKPALATKKPHVTLDTKPASPHPTVVKTARPDGHDNVVQAARLDKADGGREGEGEGAGEGEGEGGASMTTTTTPLDEFDALAPTAPALAHLTSRRARPKAGGRRLPSRTTVRARREGGPGELFAGLDASSSTSPLGAEGSGRSAMPAASARKPQPRAPRPRPAVRRSSASTTGTTSDPESAPASPAAVPGPGPPKPRPKPAVRGVHAGGGGPGSPATSPAPHHPDPTPPSPRPKPTTPMKPAFSGGKPVFPDKPSTSASSSSSPSSSSAPSAAGKADAASTPPTPTAAKPPRPVPARKPAVERPTPPPITTTATTAVAPASAARATPVGHGGHDGDDAGDGGAAAVDGHAMVPASNAAPPADVDVGGEDTHTRRVDATEGNHNGGEGDGADAHSSEVARRDKGDDNDGNQAEQTPSTATDGDGEAGPAAPGVVEATEDTAETMTTTTSTASSSSASCGTTAASAAQRRTPLTDTEQTVLRRAVRAALRDRDIELWLAPHSDDAGGCTVTKALVELLTSDVLDRPELNSSKTVIFGRGGGNQLTVHPADVFAAVEKLRISARKKLNLPLPGGDPATYDSIV